MSAIHNVIHCDKGTTIITYISIYPVQMLYKSGPMLRISELNLNHFGLRSSYKVVVHTVFVVEVRYEREAGKSLDWVLSGREYSPKRIIIRLSPQFFDDVDRAAVCDLNRERADRIACKYGWGNVYNDLKQMVKNERLDGVIVCVGARSCVKVSAKVLENGLPVFLEKPSSIDLEGTLKIAKVAKKKGLIVQVGHQKRHGLAYTACDGYR